MPVGGPLDEEEEPMQRYHIEVPPPLPGTSSRQALRAENMMLRDVIKQAGIALEEDYAQMKLMDLENERLRKKVFEKGKRKNQGRLTSGHARHMTAAENLDFLARQDWESRMKDVFKEVAPRFRILKKNILDYQREIEKAKKVAEREARKAATAAARAAWGRGRGRSHGRITGNRGGARGRGGRGRGAAAGGAGTDADDSDSEPLEPTESSGSSSNTSTVSEGEIPMPRSRRERPIRVIRGHHKEVAEDERIQPAEQLRPRPHPRPHPRMCNRPPESQDIREIEAEESSDMDVVEDDRPEALQAESGQGCAVGPEVRIGLVPGVMEDGLEMQGRDVGVPAKLQSGGIETMAGPSRRRNPRRGVQLDTTNT